MCPHCDYPVERDFIRCPSCLQQLKERCAKCSQPLDPAWTICPYCETEVVGGSVPAATRTRSRRSRAARNEQATRAERPGRRDRADPALGGPDLLGSTIEADELMLSDPDGVAPVPASERPSSRRPRPTSR